MEIVCDRCGEPPEQWEGDKKATVFCEMVDGEDVGSTLFLCPSCMAKLNDWLKGEQERQAKWIYDHESNSIECDKCRAEYKLSPYERVSDFDYCPNCGSRMEGVKE